MLIKKRLSGYFLFICMAVLLSSLGHSAWKDPLVTPSVATLKAHQTLLLDITLAGKRLVAAGAYGHIIYSDDNGLNWRQGNVPVSVTLTSIYFPTENQGWAVGHDGVILHSNDAGQNWQQQFDGYAANLAMVESADIIKKRAEKALKEAIISGDSEAVDKANDHLEMATYALEDAHYDEQNKSTKPFLNVWFYDVNTGYAVGAYGMFFHTEDGGKTWLDASPRIPNPDRRHINDIVAIDDESIVLVGESGVIFRSDDMGMSWRHMPSPYEGSLFGLVSQEGKQLLFGLRGNTFVSFDNGIGWNKVNTGAEQTLLAGSIHAGGALLVGNGGSAVTFDHAFQENRVLALKGRKAFSGVTCTEGGVCILVGESGVKRVTVRGDLINEDINMMAGELQ